MMTILNILGMQDDPHGKGICSLWEAFTNLFAVDTPHYHTAISWLLLAGGAVLAFCTLRSQRARKYIMRHLLTIAVGIFMLGTGLYIIGFNGEGSHNNPLVLLLRSMLASVEMFVSESELIEVEPALKENPYYMLIFSIVHFLATCVSAALILHILGLRATSFIRMHKGWPPNWLKRRNLDIYIFFDLSQESLTLARSIYEKARSPLQIIFVRTPQEESHHERFSFSHLLSLTNSKNNVAEELTRMNAMLTYSRTGITLGTPTGSPKEWAKNVGLTSLWRFINRRAARKFFFCLSPNEENNINTAIALHRLFPDTEKEQVFCRAKRSGITQLLTTERIRVIDTASLSVKDIRENALYQPVRYVKPDTTLGIATKPFKAVIIGFGDTGQELFKFLYEFSAMVYAKDISTPFECFIIDPKAKVLEQELLSKCPGIRHDKDSLHFMCGRTEDFSREWEALIKEVDYIAVCTNSSEGNLSLGMQLLDMAYRLRDADKTLSIFTGIYDSVKFANASYIADYYRQHTTQGAQTELFRFELVPFGKREDIFSYANVLQEETIERAKSFHYEYQKTKLYEYGGETEQDPEKEWNKRAEEFMQDGMSGKAKLTQQEIQDMANVYHMTTKKMLMGITREVPAAVSLTRNARGKEAVGCVRASSIAEDGQRQQTIARILGCAMQRIQDEVTRKETEAGWEFNSLALIEQVLGTEEQGRYKTLLQNIARCEHLRWVASNTMLGYTADTDKKDNGKDYIRKTHACMIPYEELLQYPKLRETIKYDYNTIWVGIKKCGKPLPATPPAAPDCHQSTQAQA